MMISGNCQYTGVAKTYRSTNCFFRESQYTGIPVILPTPSCNNVFSNFSNNFFFVFFRYLFSFIQKDRQCESLVEKLCHRFRAARFVFNSFIIL